MYKFTGGYIAVNSMELLLVGELYRFNTFMLELVNVGGFLWKIDVQYSSSSFSLFSRRS